LNPHGFPRQILSSRRTKTQRLTPSDTNCDEVLRMPCPAKLSSDIPTLRHTRSSLVVGTKLGAVFAAPCPPCRDVPAKLSEVGSSIRLRRSPAEAPGAYAKAGQRWLPQSNPVRKRRRVERQRTSRRTYALSCVILVAVTGLSVAGVCLELFRNQPALVARCESSG
jgi:hypothetical protein